MPAEEAKTPEVLPSPFIPAIQLPMGCDEFYPVEGGFVLRTFSSSDEDSEDPFIGIKFGTAAEGGSVEFPKHLRFPIDLAQMNTPLAIYGRLPSDLFMLTRTAIGRTYSANIFNATSKGWTQKSAHGDHEFGRLAQVGASLIALTLPLYSGKPEITTLRGPARTLHFSPRPKNSENCPEWRPNADVTVWPETIGSTRNGQVLAYGQTCDETPSLEVWKTGSPSSTILSVGGLPKGSSAGRIVPGALEDEAWILGDFVVHYRGGATTVLERPSKLGILDGAVGEDGSLWVREEGQLYKRAGNSWQKVDLPESARPDGLVAAQDGTIWVLSANVLFRLARPSDKAPAPAIKIDKKARAEKPPRPFSKPGSAKCKNHVVALYAFSKTTPDDYDFPLTRKALKGHTEFTGARFAVTRDAGQRFFAALVPSFEMGQKLQKHIAQEVQGSKPQLVCAEPEILREIKLNLGTGEIAKP